MASSCPSEWGSGVEVKVECGSRKFIQKSKGSRSLQEVYSRAFSHLFAKKGKTGERFSLYFSPVVEQIQINAMYVVYNFR